MLRLHFQIFHIWLGGKIILWQLPKTLKTVPIDTITDTDANRDGLKAVCKNSYMGCMWTKQDHVLQIITLKLLGANLGLLCFFKDNKKIKHFGIMMDYNTTVAYINNIGEIRSNLCGYRFSHPNSRFRKCNRKQKLQNGNLRRDYWNRLLVHLLNQILIY